MSPAYLVYIPATKAVKKVRLIKTINTSTIDQGNVPDIKCDAEVAAGEDSHVDIESNDEEPTQARRYPSRDRRPPNYLTNLVSDVEPHQEFLYHCYNAVNTPNSYKEAMISEESNEWRSAMQGEIEALISNDAFEEVPVPEQRKVISGRWVFARKIGDNNVNHFKARYVAKGFHQLADLDYKETFSPTVRMNSIRMLIQMCAGIVHQLDFNNAYLQANIDHEIFVRPPEGYQRDGLVWKLRKSLYGLKQSGRNWHCTIQNFFIKQEFSQSIIDNCVFTKFGANDSLIIIIFVDDLIIAGTSQKALDQVKKTLAAEFRIKDLGRVNVFLGIKFIFGDDSIKMTQEEYVDKLLQKFRMQDSNPKMTPCDLSVSKSYDGESQLLEDITLYREIVGSLIYLTTCTRPDIGFVVNKLSQRMSCPTHANLNLAKTVLRYLKGTKSHGLVYQSSESISKIVGFCDADWGGSVDRRSVSGYIFRMGTNDSPIAWSSKKQPIVALSTCEAEYIAITHAVKEAKFLSQLRADLTGSNVEQILLYVDNQSAIALAKNPVHHQRSKHIDIRYHYIRDEIKRESIRLEYIPSDKNVSDILTKPLSRYKFSLFNICK